MLMGHTFKRTNMLRVTILLSNCSFENILSQCMNDNFPFLIDYINSDIYLII